MPKVLNKTYKTNINTSNSNFSKIKREVSKVTRKLYFYLVLAKSFICKAVYSQLPRITRLTPF